jgi:hypothetical protein
VHAIRGAKRVVSRAGAGIDVTARSLTATECRGYYLAGPFDLRAGCTRGPFFEVLPHWLPMSFAETAPAPRGLKVAWQQAGGAVQIPVTRDLSGADALDLRLAGEAGAAGRTHGSTTTMGAGPTCRGPDRAAVNPAANPLGKVEAGSAPRWRNRSAQHHRSS